MKRPRYPVEVFYDGACPICVKEMRLLRFLDRRGRLAYTDIAAPGFDAAALGTSYEALMAEMHCRLADGTWVRGVEAFRRMYSAVGLGPLVPLTRLPGIAQFLDWAYLRFAARRLRLAGRCEGGSCTVGQAPS